jgi:hypothetical protein
MKDSSHTGRFIIKDLKTNKKFLVEPIDNSSLHTNWGDINPATHKVEGSYGKKFKGSVTEEESLLPNVVPVPWNDVIKKIEKLAL